MTSVSVRVVWVKDLFFLADCAAYDCVCTCAKEVSVWPCVNVWPSVLHPRFILTLVFLFSALPLIAHVGECFLCSGELNSYTNNPIASFMQIVVTLMLYEQSLPAKSDQAWWNELFIASIHCTCRAYSASQLQADDCCDGNHRVELLRLLKHLHGYVLHAFSRLFFGQCQSCTSALWLAT